MEMIEDKEFLAKGKRGVTYRGVFNGREVVVKEKNPDSQALGAIKNEFEFLKKLNEYNIGPDVIDFNEGKLVMEYVSGEQIIPFLETHGKDEVREVLRKVFDQLRKMDELGINKGEMGYPYKHIIVRNFEPKMIDFEKCRFTEKPQNVTQFTQFLISERISTILGKKGLVFDTDNVLEKAKEYKNSYTDKSYMELLEALVL